MITIATLKAAGLTAEQVVAVLEAEAAELALEVEAKREVNRVRMRAVRAANKANDAAQREQLAHRKSESALSSLLTSSEFQQPEKPREEKKERAKRNRGTVCPDDFAPSESHFEAGGKHGLSRPQVVACCEAMRAWSQANSHRAVALKTNWSAALFGWISREVERMAKSTAAPRPGSREDRSEKVVNALQDLKRFANGCYPESEPGESGGPDRPPPLGLPFAKSA